MKLFQKTVLMLAILIFTSASAHAATRVEFILDVSGSMNAVAGGEKKIAAARKAIATAVKTIPDGSVVALRLYGHRVPNKNKAESCKDSQLVISFAPINKPQFLAAVEEAKPLGQTPIAFSLQEAAKDFGAAKDEQTTIILVSDGEETCGGDPVAVAKDLIAKGFKLTIHTIGFDVDPKTRAQLQGISKATGGEYRDAGDAAGLAQSLEQLTQESLVIKKEKSIYGAPLRGGDSYETAVALTPDQLHRLDHHQKKNDFDYFYIDLKGGQKLTATLNTGEKGVSIRDDKSTENTNPYAGFQIHNSARQKILNETIIGSRNAKKELWLNLANGNDGRYYILIGNTYNDQHKDNSFKIEVTDRFDAGSQKDAGDKETTSVTIQPGEFTSHMGPGDKIDMYKFTAAAGGTYNIKARASSDELKFRMIIFDSDGVQLTSADSPNPGAAVKIENLETPKGGDYFIKLSSYYSSIPMSDYKMTLAAGGSSPTPPPPPPTPETDTPDLSLPPPLPTPPPPPKETLTTPTATPTEVLGKKGPPLPPYEMLSFWARIKYHLMHSGIPLAAGLIIGLVIGYIKGRKK